MTTVDLQLVGGEKTKRRIMIGIPCYGKPAVETFEDYMAMMYYFGRRYPEFDFFLGVKTKAEQFRARNSIIEASFQVGADFCLMLDDDQVFVYKNKSQVSPQFEYLRKFVAHMDANKDLGLVGGLYFHRGGQVRPVLLVKDTTKPGDEYRYLRDDELTGGLQYVDVQGGGCMLIRMTAIEFCQHPWFEPELKYGTDFQIAMKVKAAGYKVACDTSVLVGHVANECRIITPENRHTIHAESSEVAEDLAMSARIQGVYDDYRRDLSEYTGKTIPELMRLEQEYKFKYRETFPVGGTPEEMKAYYAGGGEAYLARTAFYLQPQFDDYILRVIRKDVPGQGMDFGCGSARVTFELARAGHRVFFRDIEGNPTYDFLKWRAKKHGIDGVTAMFEGEPANASCDYVTFLDSIEHMPDWREQLDLAVSKLKPEGVIICNFLLNNDVRNPEHIFMDKKEFLKHMINRGMYQLNPVVFKKQMVAACDRIREDAVVAA